MVRIVTTAYSLGGKKEDLKKICLENPSWNYDKLLLKTGVQNRHVLTDIETPESLSIKAAKNCIDKLENKNIDGIIYVSQSPSAPLPSRACILQEALGITKNTLAFDVNQGCSGFVYALSLATALIKNKQANRIIIICSDYYTKYIKKSDRTCRPIFSDGAAATVVEDSKSGDIGPFIFKTDGSGSHHLKVDKNNIEENLYMNGPEVLKFSLNLVPEATHELLKKSSLSVDEIDLFIFHQASAVVLNKLRKKLNIPEDKWINEIKNLGNTVSATIPIALNNLMDENVLKKKKNIVVMGFGVGLSVAGCIVRNYN